MCPTGLSQSDGEELILHHYTAKTALGHLYLHYLSASVKKQTLAKTVVATLQSENADFAHGNFFLSRTAMPG